MQVSSEKILQKIYYKKTIYKKSRPSKLMGREIFFEERLCENLYPALLVKLPRTPNIKLTTNHATAINAKPTPACLRIVKPLWYFLSSPAAVTMLKPPYKSTTNVIKDKSPRTQLIAVLIIVINPLCPLSWPVPANPIPAVALDCPNELLVSVAKAGASNTPTLANARAVIIKSFFIGCFVVRCKSHEQVEYSVNSVKSKFFKQKSQILLSHCPLESKNRIDISILLAIKDVEMDLRITILK